LKTPEPEISWGKHGTNLSYSYGIIAEAQTACSEGRRPSQNLLESSWFHHNMPGVLEKIKVFLTITPFSAKVYRRVIIGK
jgi:hypothetical protein